MELHCHTATGSGCGKIPPEEIAWLYKEAGYYGVVITDHFYVKLHHAGDKDEYRFKVDKLLTGFRRAKKNAPKGFPVLLGAEIGLGVEDDKNHYLIYGVNEEFLYNNIEIAEMSLAEIRVFLHENNMLIYQAHPFRDRYTPADPKLLDGAEAFNDPRLNGDYNVLADNWTKANNVQQISGSDCHRYDSIASGGVCFPTPIDTNDKLVSALVKGGFRIKRNYDME